jgi:maleylacetate reductase
MRTEGEFIVQAHERIVFGRAAGEAVVAEVNRFGAARVFIVTNRSLAQASQGPLQRLAAALGSLHAGIFAGMTAHSHRQDVVAAANAAREAKADLLIALGGGSVIDGTKAALLCLWLGLDSAQALAAREDGAQRGLTVPPDAVRMLAVPTTFSAAEFTSTAAVNDEATRTKHVLAHRLFAARSIVLDPAATMATPMRLLLATGVRALDHAIESFCSPAAHSASEALSVQGLRLLANALPAIHRDPADGQMRLQAQLGVWQAVAPVAAGVSVGASHGIGYVLGGTYGVPHGETSCVLLPAVLRWNAVHAAPRQRELARAMGWPEDELARRVGELIAGLGLPRSLRALGITRDALDDIASRALKYPAVQENPRRIASAADVREILDLAW